MKRIISLIITVIFVFGIFSESSYSLDIEIDYLNVKIGASRVLSYEFEISEHKEEPLALYDDNKKIISDLGVHSKVIVMYDSSADKLEIYDLTNELLATMDIGSSNYIGSSNISDSIISVNGRSYRGFVYFVINSNRIDVVNHVQLEEYLYGVVPREMPTWGTSVESLKAQTLAARTYAVMNRNSHSSQDYGLCDTVHCQVYGGYYSDRDGILESLNSTRAVDDTRNEVITNNGRMVSTHYHANSGGHTESSEYVWSNALAYERGKADPYSLNTTDSIWERTLSLDEIEQKLKTAGHNVGRLQDMQVIDKTPSGRVYNIKLIGSSGEKTIRATAFRSAVGGTVIKSTWFNMEKIDKTFEGSVSIIDRLGNTIYRKLRNLSVIGGDRRVRKITGPVTVIGAQGEKRSLGAISPSQIKFTGKGYGHGVGMSQRGAMEMGRQGFTYEEILKFYYTGIEIQDINQ